MTSLEPQGPNAEQIRYWNETAGPKWVALQEMIDAHIRALGEVAIERAAPRPGERVFDVGCGCGETTLALARQIAPGGSVTGVDISAPMLARARDSARSRGIDNATFENADAQTHALPGTSFDLLFSRFGIMFFADPTAAFTNLQRALRPGGRATFICWQAVQLNPWAFIPLMAAAPHIALPPPPAPDAPGPFAFADADRVKKILGGAGFKNVELESVGMSLLVGGAASMDRAVDFLVQMGPTAAALRDADPAVQPRVAAAIREALVPYYVEGEGVRMDAAAWVVTAAA